MPKLHSDVPHVVTVAATPEEALRAVAQAAEDWGAEWQTGGSGGDLELPVSAGLRYGRLSGRISVERTAGAGAEVVFRPERAEYRLWTRAVFVLGLSALGALVTIVWPFYPRLLGLAPVGALLGLSAWLLIVSQLRHEGAAEFLGEVAARIEVPEGAGIEEPGERQAPPAPRIEPG